MQGATNLSPKGSGAFGMGKGPLQPKESNTLALTRFIVVGACNKGRVEGELKARLGDFRRCLTSATPSVANGLFKITVSATGELTPRVEGVPDGATSKCLLGAMKKISVKTTRPGACLIRWGLR
jgi:hypothetical protein